MPGERTPRGNCNSFVCQSVIFPKTNTCSHFFFIFWGMTLGVHIAPSSCMALSLPFTRIHSEMTQSSVTTSPQRLATQRSATIPNLHYIKPRCGGQVRLPRMHTIQPVQEHYTTWKSITFSQHQGPIYFITAFFRGMMSYGNHRDYK